MRVDILGPLRLRDDRGGSVPIGGKKLGALLSRLALDADRPVSAAVLSEAVWPDQGPADPRHALQALVSRLRAALPEGAEIHAAANGYRLAVPPEAVDAHRFERLAGDGRRALEAGNRDEATRLLREALALWRGEPLEALPDHTAAASRLNELRLSAIEHRIAAELPDHAAALIPELTELTDAHPLRERLHALLIDALRIAGRQAEALGAFEKIRERLADRLGADPGPQLREAHLAALRTEPDRPRGNLRARLGGLIGRETERARISERLDEGRLVTLVGPGGVGKTSLAADVCAELRPPGGVWMAELASVTDPGDVPAAAASALGLRYTGPPRDTLTRLAETLGSGAALLVLDNCEHVVDAAAALASELLGRCPDLTVLATGREPLGITGELLVPIAPLDIDAAVRLFTERAKAVRPDFEHTAENTEQLDDLCRRLDGLPLAIELAAARLRTTPLETIVARLDDRFALLRDGSRAALPRHRALDAVVAWSWDQLTYHERDAAERLAVFPGGFTAEAAEHLGAPTESLVDKSLLQFDGGRYRMLETIREFALARAADTPKARAAHAAYFLDLAERADPHLCGADQLPWIARLSAERENLGAALDFACETEDSDTAVRLAAALAQYWAIQGEHATAATRLRAALEIDGPAPAAAREQATTTCLFHAMFAGSPEIALEADPPLRPANPLGRALRTLIDGGGLDPVLDSWPEPDQPWKRGMFALVRALFLGNVGDMAAMRDELAASAAEFGRSGDRWGLANTLTYASMASSALGDHDTAMDQIEDAIAAAAELGSDAYQRVNRALIRIAAGHPEQARTELEALSASVAGLPTVTAGVALAELARHRGDTDEARRRLDLAGARTAADPMVESVLADARGRLEVESGRTDAARGHFAKALTLSRGSGDMGLISMTATGLAMLRSRLGEHEAAAELLGAASPWELAMSGLDTRRLAADLRRAIGERAYTDAFDRGAGLDSSGVLALVEAQIRR